MAERSKESYLAEIRDWAALGLENLQQGNIGAVAENLTSCRDLAHRALNGAIVPPDQDPPPPVPVELQAYLGFGGNYLFSPEQHYPAVDCYLGRTDLQAEWGPHHGLPLYTPVAGTAEVYQFPTPLGFEYPHENKEKYMRRHAELFLDGWTCINSEDLLQSESSIDKVGFQTMVVSVLHLTSPVLLGDQKTHLVWFGHGHCKPGAAHGPLTPGSLLCESWDSGIRFEPRITARAAHVHLFGGSTETLSPNGNIPGQLIADWLGWKMRWDGIPGPNEYSTGNWVAGKPRSMWNGREIPKIPS